MTPAGLQSPKTCDIMYQEYNMTTIRYIGGMWRRIEGTTIRSFSSYQDAVDNKTSWEDLEPQSTSDDVQQQMKD